MRDQLEGLLERVEIDVMSNSDNVAIRKVKREGGREGGGRGGGREGGREGYCDVREALIFTILQAVTAGFFYHTARLSKGGVYKSVKHQQVNYNRRYCT